MTRIADAGQNVTGMWSDAEHVDFRRGLPTDWIDASTIWPESYAPIVETVDGLYCSAQDGGYINPRYGPPYSMVDHWLAVTDIGAADDVEVSLRYECVGFGFGSFSQVNPCVCVDLDSPTTDILAATSTPLAGFSPGTGHLEMGVMPVWDVGIPAGATYLQNTFRTPDRASTFDIEWYTPYTDSLALGFLPRATGENWVTIRVENGMVSYEFNGERRGGRVDPFPLPAYATGTWAGLHMVGIDYAIGTDPFGVGVVTESSPVLITDWNARTL